ncbi:MAG: beta-lactamase family protein, partial [Mycobacterium sp.]|nr:beta-lactamase family protein [Mycobacterium sp.]
MFGKPSVRMAIAVGTVLLTLAAACSRGNAARTAVSDSARAMQAPAAAPTSARATQAPAAAPPSAQTTQTPDAIVRLDFATVSKLINDAIAAHRLPGAVVVIGHGGRVVFQQAYGSRKLAGEPGLDGLPAPAEPMTEDTIFDMASLTKPLATATAVMQLYELGKVAFDDAVQKYLPDFNPADDPG